MSIAIELNNIVNEIPRLQTAKANIKSAIESKGVTVGDGTIDTYAEKISEISVGGSGDYEQGYEDGKNSVIQLEKYASTIRFENNDDSWMNEEMIFNFDNLTTLQNLFTCHNYITKRLIINCSKQVTNSTRTFYFQGLATGGVGCVMEHITFNCDISKSGTVSQMIANMPNLRVFDGSPLDLSSSTNNRNFVQYCHNLEYIRIVPNTIKYSVSFAQSSKLSDESVQSIIDGLADSGGTAQTLTLHATVGDKLTDEQKATITAKNWTLVY